MRHGILGMRGVVRAGFMTLVLPAVGTAARAAVIDVTASDNAFVLRSATTTDQSEGTNLTVKRLNDSNTRIAYLRFDLSDFFAHHTPADVSGASLKLTETGVSSGVTSDTVLVWGLNDSAANTGTDGTSETNWTESITWNTQPAGDANVTGFIAKASSALPNANTTATLGSLAIDNTLGVVREVPLTLPGFADFLSADTNGQVTLLFAGSVNDNLSFASRANANVASGTPGYVAPTLELQVADAVPEPTAAAVLAAGAGALALRRRARGAGDSR